MRKFLVNGALVLGGIVVSLILLEVGLRLFYPQNTLARVIALSPNFYRRSDLLSLELQRNFDGQVYSGEINGYYSVHTNSAGMRDQEISVERLPNTYRILILGDSFTFGYSSNDGDEYPAVLESCLNSQGTGEQAYEVINAGYASGHAPDSYYVFLREIGMEYNPDLVIVGYYAGNDFGDMVGTAWPEQEDGLPLRVVSTLYAVDESGRYHNIQIGARYQYPILRNSHLFQALVDSRLIPISQDSQIVDTIPYQFADVFRPQLTLQLHEAFDRSMGMLDAMAVLSDEHDTDFLVALLPAGVQTDAGQWYPNISGLEYPASPEEAYPQRAIRAHLDEHGIAYLDLLPAFWGRPMWDYYLRPDGHWTVSGNQLAADTLCQDLFSQPLTR